jgi:hypothetical protein
MRSATSRFRPRPRTVLPAGLQPLRMGECDRDVEQAVRPVG